MSSMASADVVRSLIPARMDRLPWARFHWMVVVGLGVSWILDGLEIQLVASAGFQHSLGMSTEQVAFAGTIYLIGQVVGALTFGRLTDGWGRKKLFILTLAIYLVGSGVAGLAMNFVVPLLLALRRRPGHRRRVHRDQFRHRRADPGQVPRPGRHRGQRHLLGGRALGRVRQFWLLDTAHVDQNWGWRIGFFIGPVMGLVIIWLRRHIPESPRWMVTHGQAEEAERIVDEIEAPVRGRRA